MLPLRVPMFFLAFFMLLASRIAAGGREIGLSSALEILRSAERAGKSSISTASYWFASETKDSLDRLSSVQEIQLASVSGECALRRFKLFKKGTFDLESRSIDTLIGEDQLGSVFIRNSDYSARLVSQPGDVYSIQALNLEAPGTGRDEVFHSMWGVDGYGKTFAETLENEDTRGVSMTESTSEWVLEMHFVDEEEGEPVTWKLVANLSKPWGNATRQERTNGFGEKVVTTLKYANSSSTFPRLFEQVTVGLSSNDSSSVMQRKWIQFLPNKEAITCKECRLTAFGLPEPRVQKPRYALFVSCAVAISVIACLFFFLAHGRRSVAS
jgi:hypothetical protein